MKRTLEEKKALLSMGLGDINNSLDIIDSYLGQSASLSPHEEIIIPESIFNQKQPQTNKSKFSWKKSVYAVISSSPGFISCDCIFRKLKIDHPFELRDKRNSKKTISAVLVALSKDGKVGKINDEDHGVFLYGSTSKHYTPIGEPNKICIEKKQL